MRRRFFFFFFFNSFWRTLRLSDRNVIPSELIPYCTSVLAAQTGLCSQDANEWGNIKQKEERADVEKYLLAQSWGSICPALTRLLADQPACPLSQTKIHTQTHTQIDTNTHMQHTLHWGQASKSNPGLLFSPARTAAPTTHTTITTTTTTTTTSEKGNEVQEGGCRMSRDWGWVRTRMEGGDGQSGWELERVIAVKWWQRRKYYLYDDYYR